MNTHINTKKLYPPFFFLIALVLFFLLAIRYAEASPGQQVETDFAAIDAYLNEQVENLGIPGMSLGIVEGGQIAHLQGFGMADSSGRPVTPQTPFHLGSITKSFTALAIMQLVDAGKIDLDVPVQTYLPWFELADNKAAARITVRHLLNHTSGISTKDGNHGFTSQQDLEGRVRELDSLALTAPVGQTFQYSNLNYDIAGLIVEKVSGQSYADYLAEYIFQPLEMDHAYAAEEPALADGLAAGHLFIFEQALELVRETPPAHLPSGYLIASAEDLAHYAMAHLNDGRYDDIRVISSQGLAELHTPAVPTGTPNRHYAMGWSAGPLEGIPTLRHSGTDGRNQALVILMPDRKAGLILLANATGFVQMWQVDEIALGIFNLLNGKPAAPVTLPLGPRFLYWAILLTPLFMILGLVYIWRHWRDKGIGFAFLVAIVYGGLAAIWWLILDNLMQAPIWSGLRVNIAYPELACGLLVSVIIGFGWSLFFMIINLRARSSARDLTRQSELAADYRPVNNLEPTKTATESDPALGGS